MFNTKQKQILDMIDENTFIISDTHFNHKTITTFEPSRMTRMMIDGHDDHTEWIVENWNNTVKPDDVVLHLGDFAFKGIQDLNGRLNGKKILILGNHDRKGNQVYENIFDFVIRGLWVEGGVETKHYLHAETTDELTSMLVKTIGDQRIMFCHYPVCESELRWTEGKKEHPMTKRLLLAKDLYYSYGCTMNVHGHTHSNNMIDRDVRVFKNASMENIDMVPIKIKELIK
jgi:calcineurin-like phosphoesterase family protein